MWNRCRLMRGSFWSAWRSRTWTRSTASRRRSRSGRRTRRAIRGRRSRRRPSCTIFCACCGRAPGALTAPIAAFRWSATRWIRSRRKCWRSRRDRAGTRCFRLPPETDHGGAARPPVRSAQEGLQRGCFRAGSVFEFSTPESLLDIDFSKPVFVLVDRLAISPATAPAPGRYRRNLLSRSGRSDLRAGRRRRIRCASTRSSPASCAARSSSSRSRACSASTIPSAPASAARDSATPSITTWIW